MCIWHIYIHNWPLQPFTQDYGLASYTTHVACVNFIREWRDLQFNVDSERQIFEKLFLGRFIYSQSFCQKSDEKKSSKKYFSYFIFDDWPGTQTHTFASNKPTHNILDHGDFIRAYEVCTIVRFYILYMMTISAILDYQFVFDR